KLIARLSGKWRESQNRKALMGLWSFTSVLALLLLTNWLSGPLPRTPAGFSCAAYSLRSSAPDLAKFLLELASPQHLDPGLMKEMTTIQVTVEEDEFWGLGVGLWHGPRGTALWHGGDNTDFHALMLVLAEQRNGVVVLTNGQKGGPLVNEVARQAVGMEINR
ncbi:MAG: serine hydrolase, partial [Anaerolineales bacterium]